MAYITHYADLYGANRSLLDLITGTRRMGAVEPFVILPVAGPLSERLQHEGIPFEVIPFKPWMTARHYEGRWYHRFMQRRKYEAAAREAAAFNADLVQRVLARITSWNAQLIHLNSLAVGIGGDLVRATDNPVIWHAREMPERQYGLHLDAGLTTYANALNSAACIVANSEATKADLQRYIGVDRPVEVVYNGAFTLIDHGRWAHEGEARWSGSEPFTFLLAGVIHPTKEQEEAVRAMASVKQRYPNARLWIAGAGKADHLEAMIHALGLQGNVQLLGHQADMHALYGRAHALLMCSRNEAFGRVTVEAMAHGLPVIGRAEAGTMEVLDQGRQGALYTNGAEELAARMLELLGDPAHARALGERGRAYVRERFNTERYADRIAAIYGSLVMK